MIGIELHEGVFLDLYPDTKISFTLNSPLFGDGEFIPGEYTLPFDVPLTEHNARHLQNPDIINNRLKQQAYENVRLWVNGLQVRKGTLALSETVPREKLSANFKFGISTIADTLKNTSIRELCAQTVQIYDPEAYQKVMYLQIWDNFDTGTEIKFILNGVEISYQLEYDNHNADVSGSLNHHSLATAINYDTEAPFFATAQSSGPFGTDQSQLRIYIREGNGEHANTTAFTYQQAYKENGAVYPISFTSNFSSQYTLFNNGLKNYLRESTAPDDTFRLLQYVNTGMFVDILQSSVINRRFATGDLYQNLSGLIGNPNARNRTVVCPQVTLRHVFSKISEQIGYTFTGAFLESKYYRYNHLFNTVSLNERVPFIGTVDLLMYKPVFNLQDHLPDAKTSDLLKATFERYGLYSIFDSNNKTIELGFMETIFLDTAYADITHQILSIDSTTCSELTGVAMESAISDQDTRSRADAYSYGKQINQTVSMKASSITDAGTTANTPHVSQDEEPQKGIRFIMQNADHTDSTITDPLQPSLLKPVLQLQTDSEEVAAEMILSLNDLINFNWKQKRRIDEINYLVKHVDLSITMEGLQTARVTLVTT